MSCSNTMLPCGLCDDFQAMFFSSPFKASLKPNGTTLLHMGSICTKTHAGLVTESGMINCGLTRPQSTMYTLYSNPCWCAGAKRVK